MKELLLDGRYLLCGVRPRYSSLGALREALAWLVAHDQAGIGDQRMPVIDCWR